MTKKKTRFGEPPSWLPDAGREAWELLAEELEDSAKVDRLAMIHACSHYATAVNAMEELAEHGALIEGARGRVKNPAAQIAREASAAFRQWVGEFGLSPAARKRLGIGAPDDEEPDEHEGLID